MRELILIFQLEEVKEVERRLRRSEVPREYKKMSLRIARSLLEDVKHMNGKHYC